MRHLFFIVFLCCITGIAKAQAIFDRGKLSFATTVGTGLSINTPSSTPFTWQLLGYYNLSERWAVGAGTGVSFHEKMLIPLYGDIRFKIGRTRKFTPYAEWGMGYSFAPQDDANGGFFMNPSLGIRYALKNKIKLRLAIGYELQELERLKTHTDDYFVKEFVEELKHHMISVKLGLEF